MMLYFRLMEFSRAHLGVFKINWTIQGFYQEAIPELLVISYTVFQL